MRGRRGLIAAAVVGAVLGIGAVARAIAPAPRDTHESLHAVLWVQTSAEYQAIVRGLYHLAALELDRALEDSRWTAIPEQAARADLPVLRAAVILDVDETVLSNAPEEGQRVLDRGPWEPATFDAWVRRADAEPLAGAVEFVRYARARDVDVYFVTNRSVDQKQATVENLTKRGIEVASARVLCRGDYGTDGDKSGRRRHIAETHRVVLMIGDDLGDFVPVSEPDSGRLLTPEERAGLVDRYSGYWEERWLVIPDPLYGSWERALYPAGLSDAEALARQRATVKGM
jgi:5'-nucleotidase (lipoprotein e(P4) family)